MKKLLALITTMALACCQSMPAPAMESTANADGTLTITLNKEQAAYCAAHGDCIVVPVALVRDAIDRARNSCGKET